jgi:WD40 repeat protein
MLELRCHRGPVVGLAYSPDGRTLASASIDGTARLWDARSGAELHRLQSPSDRARCVAFSPKGELLAVGYERPHGYVQLWELPSMRRREQWAPSEIATRAVAFRFGEQEELVVAGNDGVHFFKASTASYLHSSPFMSYPPTGMAVVPDGGKVSVISGPGVLVQHWQMKPKPRRSVQRVAIDNPFGHSIVYSKNGESLSCGLEREVVLFHLRNWRQVAAKWPAHDGAVLGVAFLPDGQSLLSAGTDGLVKHWTLDGRLIRTIDWRIGELGAVAIAPDGLTAAVGGAESIAVWDLEP